MTFEQSLKALIRILFWVNVAFGSRTFYQWARNVSPASVGFVLLCSTSLTAPKNEPPFFPNMECSPVVTALEHGRIVDVVGRIRETV